MTEGSTTESTLHVGFVGPYPPTRGGIAQHSEQLVGALRERGHRVTVHAYRAQYPRLLYRGQQAVPRRTVRGHVNWSMSWWAPWSWVRVGLALRAVDVVVFPWVHPFHAAILWLVLALSRRPSVAVVHNLTPHEPFPGERVLARWVLRRTSGLVCHASEVARDAERLLPSRAQVLVPHPPNLSVTPAELPAGPPAALFLGYVRPYKGVDVLLDAMTGDPLGDGGWRLTIAGEMWDPTEDELGNWVRDLGLQERVTLEPGYVSDERLVELLRCHHVLVAPYRSASQSGVVPLAHAAGRPVVATDVGGLREQVADGRNGVVVRGGDAAALAEGLERALSDLDRLATGALEAAPSWADVACAIEALTVGLDVGRGGAA